MPGVRIPSPTGKARRSHRPQEPSQKWPAAGTSPYKAVLTVAHAAVHLLPRSSCLAAAREHTPDFNPPQTTHGRHRFCGTPRDHLHQHTHLQTLCSSASSAFAIKIHLQKPGLKLRQHKLSSDLGLWVRRSDISEELLAEPHSF